MAAVYKSISKANGEKDSVPNGVRKNKQKVLVLTSRGVNQRHRHLLNDLSSLLPHSKKESKFDSKSKLYQLNELAELNNCNNLLFFEARKGKDLYVWMSKVPNGPTVKFHAQNLHTMEELQFTGNCLKGSRPILSFDAAFDKDPFLKVIRELLLHIFGVPQGARRSKPFIDHVLGFSVLDGKIWMRNYEVKEVEGGDDEDVEMEGTDDHQNRDEKDKNKKAKGGKKDTGISLVEIGPRVVLTPIVIQEGSFGGPIIYENKEFVSPNQVRTDLRRQKATKYNTRADQAVERAARRKNLGLDRNVAERELDELDKRKLFA